MKFKTTAEKLNKYRHMELKYYSLQYGEWLKQAKKYEEMEVRAEENGEHICLTDILKFSAILDRIDDIDQSLIKVSSDLIVREAVKKVVTRGETAQSVCTKGEAGMCLNAFRERIKLFYLFLDERTATKISTSEKIHEVWAFSEVNW